MTLTELKRMLPREEGFRRLKSWIVNYLGTEFVWDLQLVLKADEVPDTIMGEAGLLGWTTWLKSGVVVQDSDQLVLSDHFLQG